MEMSGNCYQLNFVSVCKFLTFLNSEKKKKRVIKRFKANKGAFSPTRLHSLDSVRCLTYILYHIYLFIIWQDSLEVNISERSDWFFLGRDFALRTISANSNYEKKTCKYSHLRKETI